MFLAIRRDSLDVAPQIRRSILSSQAVSQMPVGGVQDSHALFSSEIGPITPKRLNNCPLL
jgi:hypothetical protein